MKKLFKFFFLAPFLALTILSGCTSEVTERVDAKAEAVASSVKESCDRGECPCDSPIGSVAHGTKLTIYDTETITCADSCDSHASETTCNNGKFDTALTGKFFTCQAAGCNSCAVGGNLVRHGESVEMYKTGKVDCSQSCEDLKLVRKCENGKLDGDTAFDQFNCEMRECRCGLPDGSGYLTLGGKVDFYSAQSASCGVRCSSLKQTRTCGSTGTGDSRTFKLDGNDTFKYASCADAPACYCQLPGTLGELTNGKTAVLMTQPAIACGQTTDELDTLSVSCVGGSLKHSTTGNVIDVKGADFKYKYLFTPPVCSSCALKGYGAINNNTKLTLCSKDKLTCADQKEFFVSEFSCDSGVLKKNGARYNVDEDPAAPPIWFNQCPLDCPGCKTPWGTTVANGAKVRSFQLMNAVSNTCGRGCKIQERICKDGKLDGDDAYNLQSCIANNCTQEGGGAPPRLCLLPYQNSYATPDSRIPLWSKRQVPCGESCQSYFKIGKCDMKTGQFDSGPEFIYSSCTELCPK